MKAEEIINSVEIEKQTDNFEFFYPELFKEKKADENLTKCLKNLKGGIK